MNRNLEKARFDIEKVDAIMSAMESAYLTIEVVPEERGRADQATNAFYALWDAIRLVADDIDRLCGDESVVDAIYAVNDVERRKWSLTTEE